MCSASARLLLRLATDLLHSCGQAHVDGYDCGQRGDYEQQFPGLYFSFASVADFLFRSVLFVFHVLFSRYN